MDSKWQPIDIAPHDTLVLLYCPHRGIANEERIEIGKATFGEYIPGVKSTLGAHRWATHWMQLPAPPIPVMDEETIRKEFEEWAYSHITPLITRYLDGDYYSGRLNDAWVAWIEATKLADRKVRTECEDICRQIGCSETQNDQRSAVAFDCAAAISKTIPEE